MARDRRRYFLTFVYLDVFEILGTIKKIASKNCSFKMNKPAILNKLEITYGQYTFFLLYLIYGDLDPTCYVFLFSGKIYVFIL